MDEADAGPARLVAAEQSVPAQVFLAFLERFAESVGRVVLVVEMYLDFAPGSPAKCREGCDEFVIVLFDGLKESVFRKPVVGIAEGRDRMGEIFGPMLNPFHCTGLVRVMERLKMVADCDEQMGDIRPRRAPPEKIGKEPFFERTHWEGEEKG
jgi:hypothetical protein